MDKKKKKILLLRLAIGLTMFVVLFLFIGWQNTWSILQRFRFAYLPLILGIAFLMIAISCFKWRIFLNDRGIKVGIWKLISLYVIGYFFNSFLPGSIGGDLARSFILGKNIKSQVESFSSIFMERFTGLVALVTIGVAAALINFRLLLRAPIVLISIIVIFVGFTSALLIIFNRSLILWLSKRIKIKKIEKIKHKLLEIYQIIYSYRHKKSIVAKALAISFVFHTMTSVNTWIVCKSLDIQMNFLDILVFIPIILLVSAVPISIGGLGLWEASFIILFMKAGIPSPEAFSISLILRSKNYLVAILGGFLFLLYLRRLTHGADRSAIVSGN